MLMLSPEPACWPLPWWCSVAADAVPSWAGESAPPRSASSATITRTAATGMLSSFQLTLCGSMRSRDSGRRCVSLVVEVGVRGGAGRGAASGSGAAARPGGAGAGRAGGPGAPRAFAPWRRPARAGGRALERGPGRERGRGARVLDSELGDREHVEVVAATGAVEVVNGARRDARGQPDARRGAAGRVPGGDDMDLAAGGRLRKASVGGVCGQQRALHKCLIGSPGGDLERRRGLTAARARLSHTDPP